MRRRRKYVTRLIRTPANVTDLSHPNNKRVRSRQLGARIPGQSVFQIAFQAREELRSTNSEDRSESYESRNA